MDVMQEITILKGRISELEKIVSKRPTQSDFLPKSVKQRNIDGLIIFTGLEDDLPDGSTQVKVFFATDTDTLYIWNGSSWVSEVFS